jgi:GTPase SAR1 family protein
MGVMTDMETKFLAMLAGQERLPSAHTASPLPAAPVKLPPRTIREGDILLGSTSSGDQVGISLGKLIEGRLLVQGNSGAGKSMLLRRLFEQAFGRIQQIVLDRDGEFSTLAEKFDVAVLTAADVVRIGGHAFALHLREHRYSAVLDLSDATSEDCVATVADLVTGLIEAPPEHWHPMLVISDETQTMVPRYDPGDVEPETRKRNIRAFADMMGRGRKRGLAGIIATSRIAETATPVVSKATNIIVGRTVFDRDLERAGAVLGFTVGQSRLIRSLSDGEFLGIGPAFNVIGRTRFKAGGVESRHKGEAPSVVAPPSISAADTAALLQKVRSAEHAAPQEPPRQGRRGRGWIDAEDKIIRDGYRDGISLAKIGGSLSAIGCSVSTGTISTRAHALGLESDKAAVGWKTREDEILREAYLREVRIIDICGLLEAEGFQRGRVSVQMRAIALGITRDRVNYWTEPEKKIAIEGLTDGTSYREIIANLRAAGFDRGITSILKFAQKNNFSRAVDHWTLDEIALLKKLYAEKMPARDIAERMQKPIGSIRTRASNLGLKQRLPWSDAEYESLQKSYRTGKTLTQAVADIGRPYPNVAKIAVDLGLNFSILPKERGKAASLLKKNAVKPTAKPRGRPKLKR